MTEQQKCIIKSCITHWCHRIERGQKSYFLNTEISKIKLASKM